MNAAIEDPSPNIQCSQIVYRAILTDWLIDRRTGRVLKQAFMRQTKDIDGLSVDFREYGSPEFFARNKFRACYGVTTLHVGHIRDFGLDVKPLPEPDDPYHALIDRLPAKGENVKEAERLARLLANDARLVWQPNPDKSNH